MINLKLKPQSCNLLGERLGIVVEDGRPATVAKENIKIGIESRQGKEANLQACDRLRENASCRAPHRVGLHSTFWVFQYT